MEWVLIIGEEMTNPSFLLSIILTKGKAMPSLFFDIFILFRYL